MCNLFSMSARIIYLIFDLNVISVFHCDDSVSNSYHIRGSELHVCVWGGRVSFYYVFFTFYAYYILYTVRPLFFFFVLYNFVFHYSLYFIFFFYIFLLSVYFFRIILYKPHPPSTFISGIKYPISKSNKHKCIFYY